MSFVDFNNTGFAGMNFGGCSQDYDLTPVQTFTLNELPNASQILSFLQSTEPQSGLSYHELFKKHVKGYSDIMPDTSFARQVESILS